MACAGLLPHKGKVARKREVEPGSIFTFMCDLLGYTLLFTPGLYTVEIHPPFPP